MDKKILNKFSGLFKINDLFYECKASSLKNHKKIAALLDKAEEEMLKIDKVYDEIKDKKIRA